MIKCIVCDLDGTLLRMNDTIESHTWDLLKECINNNIEFIIATGRDINMVIDILDKYNLDCDLILNNGAQYCNRNKTFNKIYPMNYDSFKKIASILFNLDYLLAIHTNQGKYSLVDQEAFWEHHTKLLRSSIGDNYPKTTFTTREGYLRDFHYEPNIDNIINKGIEVLKIDARHLLDNTIEGVRSSLNVDHLDISSSYGDNIEITSDQSNKGKMLDYVITKKGYTSEEVAVFGDGINDVHMLESFKYSFAPSDACKEALEACNYKLTKNCVEGAVGEGIEQLKKFKLL